MRIPRSYCSSPTAHRTCCAKILCLGQVPRKRIYGACEPYRRLRGNPHSSAFKTPSRLRSIRLNAASRSRRLSRTCGRYLASQSFTSALVTLPSPFTSTASNVAYAGGLFALTLDLHAIGQPSQLHPKIWGIRKSSGLRMESDLWKSGKGRPPLPTAFSAFPQVPPLPERAGKIVE